MNGRQFIEQIEKMESVSSLIHEGKDGMRYQFIRHSSGWDVWVLKGSDNVSVHKVDKIEDVKSLIVFYNRGVYVGSLCKTMLGLVE